MLTIDLDAELAALPEQSLAQLRQRWSDLLTKPVPRVSAALMRLALAWEMQAAVQGGLSPRVEQRLARLAAVTDAANPRPKRRLLREWKGVLHIVTIEADETIRGDGQTWRSLSEVARTITGTRWSGPAFFGLKHKSKAA